MLKEFRAFALKGNVMDLAVGVVIGGAFGKIVTSMVNDILMPLISLITGKIDFTNLFIALNANGVHYKTLDAAKEAGVATINYGTFITNIVDFIIIAFSIFIAIRFLEKLKKEPLKEVVIELQNKECPYCLSSISIKASRCPHCTSNLE